MVKLLNQLPLPKAHFRTTNEMLDEFAFLGKTWLARWFIENTNAWQKSLNLLEVVKGDLYAFH